MSHEHMIESLERIIENISVIDSIPYSEKKLRAYNLLANLYADNCELYKSFICQVRAMSEHNNMYGLYTSLLREYLIRPRLIETIWIDEEKKKILHYSNILKKTVTKLMSEDIYLGVCKDMDEGYTTVENNLDDSSGRLKSYFFVKNNLQN